MAKEHVISGSYDYKLYGANDLESRSPTVTIGGVPMKLTDTKLRDVHDMLSVLASGEYTEATLMDNFNRFYKIFPDTELPGGLTSYVFITRPDLNIYTSSTNTLVSENKNDVKLQYMQADYPELLHMLTLDYDSTHQFIPFLQGRTESLQLPDYQISTSEFTIPFYNYKMIYPGVTNESLTGGTFDITFREDNRMRVTKFFEFWIYYIDAIRKNKMKPAKKYIKSNTFDFMCSVYEFICDPSSERILFFSKYTGCFPTSVSISNYSHNLHGTIDNKVSITFAYMVTEHMQPMIITDFMNNRSLKGDNYVEVYDEIFSTTGTTLVGCPTIYRGNKGTGDYYLKWYARKKGLSSSLITSPSIKEFYTSNQAASNYIKSFQNSNYAYQY